MITEVNNTEVLLPQISIDAWMIAELHLTGNSLVVFAYLFAQTFDNVHPYQTSSKVLSKLCNVTPQTLARTIEKLPFIIRNISQDNPKGFYVYNYYRIDIEKLLSYLEGLGNDTYKCYIQMYRERLEKTFVNESDTVETHIQQLTNGNKTEQTGNFYASQHVFDSNFTPEDSLENRLFYLLSRNSLFRSYVEQICKDLYPSTNESKDNQVTNTNNSNNSITDNTQSHSHKAKNPVQLGCKPTKQQKITQTKNASKTLLPKKTKNRLTTEEKILKRNEMVKKLKDEAISYVLQTADNNQELLELLYNYIEEVLFAKDTDYNVISFNQFKAMLFELGKIKDIDYQIQMVRTAYTAKYRTLSYKTPDEIKKINKKYTDNVEALKLIKQFSIDYNYEGFEELLQSYWSEVWSESSRNLGQFKRMLQQLRDAKLEPVKLYEVVESAYTHKWYSWVFETNNYAARRHSPFENMDLCLPENNPIPTSKSTVEEREKAIDDMWKKYYLYMNTDLKDALLKYVREVPAGCVKTYNEVCECIDNLVHRRFTDSDMLSAVTTAIDNNYPELCRKDFEKEEKLKKQFRTIQEFVDLATEERRRLCRQSRRIQDDPKFAGMPD